MRADIRIRLTAIGMALLFASAGSRGETIFSDNFDAYPVGSLPRAVNVSAPTGTVAEISDLRAASGRKSFRFEKLTGSGGAYPQAIVAFPARTGGIIRVSYKALTGTSNHDALYLKLRNERGQEIGGMRFSPEGAVQYQRSDGTWTNTTASYAAQEWYNFVVSFDLSRSSYDGWLNGKQVFDHASFRVPSRVGASLIIQDRVVAGSGYSYIDDLRIENLPARGNRPSDL